jgi:hypothetical protein
MEKIMIKGRRKWKKTNEMQKRGDNSNEDKMTCN